MNIRFLVPDDKCQEQESLPAIDYRSHLNFKNLKSNQDNLSNNCLRLPVLKQNIEREYTYYTNEEITYLDYTYCVNETKATGTSYSAS
jgi:hypothetical protein